MIVSHAHSYIFVKTRKTAGTSVEIALSTHAGADDVITPFRARDELVRAANPNARLPQNYCDDARIEETYRDLIASGDTAAIRRHNLDVIRKAWTFRSHMSLAEARDALDRDFYERALKFTIQRHPYEKAVSLAYFVNRNTPERPIDDAIETVLDDGACNNTHFYMVDGTIGVNLFLRYEHLQEDVERLGDRIGAPGLWDNLPLTKHDQRTDRRPARDILSEAQKRRVQAACRAEFDLFGYET